MFSLKYSKNRCFYTVYKYLDLRHRRRRTQSKKADEREETMGFSAMDETLIKGKCLCICDDFYLNFIKQSNIYMIIKH